MRALPTARAAFFVFFYLWKTNENTAGSREHQ